MQTYQGVNFHFVILDSLHCNCSWKSKTGITVHRDDKQLKTVSSLQLIRHM